MEPSSNRHEPTANSCILFQLPHPLILDILSRFPIRDLLHCSCICKRFISFISDPEFASLHLSISPLCILTNTKPLQKCRKRLQLSHVYAGGASFQVSKLNFTPKSNVPTWDISDISACNGLLCLLGPKKGDPFYVFSMCVTQFWVNLSQFNHLVRVGIGVLFGGLVIQLSLINANFCKAIILR
ncbi:hypothetical protein Goklo_024166 [Gossypium klotzschianum]|uniref:F-box domain-containing protein n=1 Tax=Gossypium klotzschianum TaxID=34286 RepID=A0A7J8W7C8_9ROSI|nr:hypothetical protein [Gossypium klotzschianum]